MVVEKLDLNLKYNINKIKTFLNKQNLKFDKVDSIYANINVYGNIIATTGRYKNILKLIAVDDEHRGENLTNELISKELEEIFLEGYNGSYIFTESKNKSIFSDFNFKVVMDTGEIILLQKGNNDIDIVLKNYEDIKNEISSFNVGTIVMNANPFTLGHKYLVDKAVEKVDKLLIFVVETDESYISFSDRLYMVKEVLKKYENIYILPSTDYIISSSTFPTYFLKDNSAVHKEYAKLDIMIFKKYFIPFFNISTRFVGEENIDESTRIYNNIMKSLLKDFIDVEEISRKEFNGIEISASRVRELLEKGEYNHIKNLVPESIYEFLIDKYGKSFKGAFGKVNLHEYEIENKNKKPVFIKSIEEIKNHIEIKNNITVSFHHHLRNGDYVLNMIMKHLHDLGVKGITLASSSFFPCHEPIIEMFKDETIIRLHGDYYSGPVVKAISEGKCKEPAIITTHGGRPREILEDELKIDIAFIAAPSVDKKGNATGSQGKSNCGVLGYAVADSLKASKVVLVTDNIVDEINQKEIDSTNVDLVLEVESIGDPKGIVSGTTQITKDPVGIKIAQNCVNVMENSGFLKEGFNFQTGAGGISLAVASELKNLMKEKNIRGGFASGGITDYLVDMLEEGYFERLYDVQCFTVGATQSIVRNENHLKMTANEYANINNENNIVNKLDFVILGATEIDLDFNVNVTTGSDGYIIGGSVGHADTSAGSKVSIIVSKLVNSRRSVVVDKVRTISTPGETVDIIVTDRGIAINPKREDLIKRLSEVKNIDLVTIDELYKRAIDLTGVPAKKKLGKEVVAISKYRDGTILDLIYKVN